MLTNKNGGIIIKVAGPVVDVRFSGATPQVNEALVIDLPKDNELIARSIGYVDLDVAVACDRRFRGQIRVRRPRVRRAGAAAWPHRAPTARGGERKEHEGEPHATSTPAIPLPPDPSPSPYQMAEHHSSFAFVFAGCVVITGDTSTNGESSRPSLAAARARARTRKYLPTHRTTW